MSTIAERLSAVNTKLNNILTNVNTQLTNKGKTAVSDLSDLPSAVGELKNPTGSISITQNGTVDVSNYASANVNVPTPEPNLQSKSIEITENGTQTITADTGYDGLDEVEVTTNVSGGQSEYNAKVVTTPLPNPSYNMYPNIAKFLKEVPVVDLTGFTVCQSFFNNCYSLETVPYIDTSNCTSFERMFSECLKIKSIPQFNTSKMTNMKYFCNGCVQLENVPILNTSKVTGINMTNAFSVCPNLTNESLNNILYMCIHSGVKPSNSKTLQFVGLSQSQANTCATLSNWDAFLDAGWTTGY